MTTKKENNSVKSNSDLRAEVVPFTEVTVQSIANIASSEAYQHFMPSVSAVAGNGTWSILQVKNTPKNVLY